MMSVPTRTARQHTLCQNLVVCFVLFCFAGLGIGRDSKRAVGIKQVLICRRLGCFPYHIFLDSQHLDASAHGGISALAPHHGASITLLTVTKTKPILEQELKTVNKKIPAVSF